MTPTTRLISSGLSNSLAAAVHAAREVDLSEPIEVIRTDFSGGIGAGRELVGDATEALADAVARWDGTSRRTSRRRRAAFALAIGIVGAIAIALLWRRRRAADVFDEEDRLDREALDRAAGEGMGMAIETSTSVTEQRQLVPVAMETAVAGVNGARSG